MTTNIDELVKQLNLEGEARKENGFYIIDLPDSDTYARMYSRLEKSAINTENPTIKVGGGKATNMIINYFETTFEDVDYNIFLMTDFENDLYKVKIGER